MSGRAKEEVEAERVANFGDLPEEECTIVCDDCYNEIMAYNDHKPGTLKID